MLKGWLGYIQSGRHTEVFGTLFTSSLGKRTTDYDKVIQLSLFTWQVGNQGDTVIRNLSQSPFSLYTGGQVCTFTTYAATLIILGLKASTCFRRVFIVFPVPTTAYTGEYRESGVTKHRFIFSAVQEKMKKFVTLYNCNCLSLL